MIKLRLKNDILKSVFYMHFLYLCIYIYIYIYIYKFLNICNLNTIKKIKHCKKKKSLSKISKPF